MPKGWDLLGVPEDVARSIYDEVVANSFQSDAADYYAHQAEQPEYDKDGNLVMEGMAKDDDPYAGMTESQKAARGLMGKVSEGRGGWIGEHFGYCFCPDDSITLWSAIM